MRLRISILFLCISTFSFADVVVIDDLECRSWRNDDNNTIRGELVKYDNIRKRVCIKRSSGLGTSFWYPINRLSESDNAYVLNSVAEIKNRLPDGLYDEANYETLIRKKDWNWYDLKYFKMDDPVTISRTSHIKYVYKSASGIETRPTGPEVGNLLKFLPRGRYRLPEYYTTSAINMIVILYRYGVTERDLAKLKWFFSAEDVLNSPSKILSAYGFEHYVGSYNYNRVKSYIDMGIPLVGVWSASYGKSTFKSLRYKYGYYLPSTKEVEYCRRIGLKKICYLKLPRN
jgi:hypothetical protein